MAAVDTGQRAARLDPPLRAVRIAQGLSLRECARRADLDPSHLLRVERGDARLSVEALHRLAGVLELRDLARLLAPYVDQEEGND